MSLETPLPGIADPAAVEDLVLWARKLVGSPRVRESDAGGPDTGGQMPRRGDDGLGAQPGVVGARCR